MERIGIAASKMAQGKFFLYNLYVVLISFLFSLFIFFLSGASILLAWIVIGYIADGILPQGMEGGWRVMARICMVTLTVVVMLLNFFAILKNIKFRKDL